MLPSSNDLGDGCGYQRQAGDEIESGLEENPQPCCSSWPGWQQLSVTFEEGALDNVALYDVLKPHVARLVVCNPRKNALLKESR